MNYLHFKMAANRVCAYIILITFGLFNENSAIKLISCECGKPNDGIENRIVGGYATSPHQYPWMAAIINFKDLHCGGALINDRYVLTAGHCIKWTKIINMSVRLGMHDKNKKDGLSIGVAQGIIHKDFTSDYLHDTNDIALLKLQKRVLFSDTVSPVCMPHPMSDYTGRTATVAGWGRVGQDANASPDLQQANVVIMRWSNCRQNSSIGQHLTDSMMCAYANDIDACQGDSGGPLLYERPGGKIEQIGVVSWGIGCARPGIPGVYTKLTNYLDWIALNTQDATYCSVN